MGFSYVPTPPTATSPVDLATQAELDAKVSDTAYNATSWNGVTDVAPSKNAVRDQIEALSGANALIVKDEGGALATAAATIDFVGAGVTASGTGADKTVTIPGASAAVYPWHIGIDPKPTAHANTNWDTIQNDPGGGYAGYKKSSGAQNAEIAWDVVLGAGTWTIELGFEGYTDAGIITVALDDGAGVFTDVGTVDTYRGTVTYARTAITGVVVPSTIKRRLRLKMATKHASSSSYFAYLHAVTLLRTA